jgi:tripartite-type tricarboxylate transporter receptor subunit TctC
MVEERAIFFRYVPLAPAELNAEFNAILSTEDMRARLANEGAEPVLMSAQEFTKFLHGEIAKFKKLVVERNIKPG